jgi:hypothetical protein
VDAAPLNALRAFSRPLGITELALGITELALGLDYALLAVRGALALSLGEAGAPFVAPAKIAKYR